jgi:hypothetical protein
MFSRLDCDGDHGEQQGAFMVGYFDPALTAFQHRIGVALHYFPSVLHRAGLRGLIIRKLHTFMVMLANAIEQSKMVPRHTFSQKALVLRWLDLVLA